MLYRYTGISKPGFFSPILLLQEQQNFRNLEFKRGIFEFSKQSFQFDGRNLDFPLSLEEKSWFRWKPLAFRKCLELIAKIDRKSLVYTLKTFMHPCHCDFIMRSCLFWRWWQHIRPEAVQRDSSDEKSVRLPGWSDWIRHEYTYCAKQQVKKPRPSGGILRPMVWETKVSCR